MIVLTLAGESKRFFNDGYNEVKYKLSLGNKKIIEHILSFIPCEEKLMIIINRKFDDFLFIKSVVDSFSFKSYQIVEISQTRGQLESVYLGLLNSKSFWNKDDFLTIYNGDTIRMLRDWKYANCDGYIEAFESDGNHWSFVDKVGRVSLVAEKQRISPFCSSGLYFFKEIRMFLEPYIPYINFVDSELYIAPYYNYFIQKGYNIQSQLVAKDNFIFCGTPDEYKFAKTLNLPFD